MQNLIKKSELENKIMLIFFIIFPFISFFICTSVYGFIIFFDIIQFYFYDDEGYEQFYHHCASHGRLVVFLWVVLTPAAYLFKSRIEQKYGPDGFFKIKRD